MARDGDEGLAGWSTQVFMGDPTADDAEPLMVPNPMDPTMMVNATLPTNDGEDNMDDLGKSTFKYYADPTMVEYPVTFTVMATPVEVDDDGDRTSVQPDMGEMWEQSDALTYVHTGLDLPPGKDDDMLDLGPIRITFTTQAVYVGVHRELDDRTGYTDYIGVGDGDDRPMGNAIGEIEVSLMVPDSRGRLIPFEYDHDMDDETDDVEATDTFGSSGMVSFAHIPADTEITVVVDAGNDIMIVPDDRSQPRRSTRSAISWTTIPTARSSARSARATAARVRMSGSVPAAAAGGRRPQRGMLDLRLQVGDRDDLGRNRRSPRGRRGHGHPDAGQQQRRLRG